MSDLRALPVCEGGGADKISTCIMHMYPDIRGHPDKTGSIRQPHVYTTPVVRV